MRPTLVGPLLSLVVAGSALVPASSGAASDRQALLAEARAAGSHCVAVVRDGRTVLSKDLDRRVDTSTAWSITKSVTSLLVGIAQDRGLLRLDDRVSRYVPEWRRTPSRRVTVRHLLANTSGREWSMETDYTEMTSARNKTRFSVRLSQQARPGTEWYYNNSAIQVLEAVLEKATGMPVHEFADRVLLRPLRMRSSSIQRDPSGNTMLFAGLVTTCPDLARLGVMLADGGKYQGRRIVSKRYLRQATQRSSSELNRAYGLLFWINEPGPVLPAVPLPEGTPTPQGPMVPGAPEDAFWAIGLGQQILHVSPSTGVVAVRLGEPPTEAAPLTVARFTELATAVARR
ncbi:serine hydrolase domain-containing protein [Nocardioides solisilvae]|uniref:serine hydrolase domain-containing protein n=1 Tax=Nocardioides solisilvae TaxID=1542435 RepID=UPI000D750BD0|nr:serine hydrolase domain-containing protein [Nocardioides solisilvae]